MGIVWCPILHYPLVLGGLLKATQSRVLLDQQQKKTGIQQGRLNERLECGDTRVE